MKSKSSSCARCALLFAAAYAVLGLSGCAATRLKADFAGYEGAFAETSNRQMLLNLARLNQHDPTFFFKLGQIGTSYRMVAGISGNGSYAIQGTAGGGNAIGGGTPSLSYEKDPSFQFIPVNDDTTAQLLMKPVPAELFYSLYQQGWRADQLFRLMVDRIEFRDPRTKGWQIIHNTASPNNAPDYARFLRVSALAYELQRRGYLLLRGHGEFVPLAKGAPFKDAPSAKDLIDAQAKNLIYQQQKSGQWELGQMSIAPEFQLNAPSDTQIKQDMPELDKGGIGGATALDTMLAILQNGFTIEENFNSPEQADETRVSCHLVMRSMIGLMTAAAQEQDGFAALMDKNPSVDATLHFKDVVPGAELHPILHLRWKPDEDVIAPLVDLTYANERYMVTDEASAANSEGSDPANADAAKYSWNRDLFRLISEIAAQVTVDISKFPVPLLLQ